MDKKPRPITQKDLDFAMKLYDRFKDDPKLRKACGKRIFQTEKEFWSFIAQWIFAHCPETERMDSDLVHTIDI